MYIEDGTGSGNKAQVTDGHRLAVFAVSATTEHHASEEGKAYHMLFDQAPTAGDDCIIYIENSFDGNMSIDGVWLSPSAATEIYFHLGGEGSVCEIKEGGHGYDQRCYDLGNYFLTEEEAAKAADRQLAYVRMTDAIREANAGWEADVQTLRAQVKHHVRLYEGEFNWGNGYAFTYLPIEMLCSEEAKEKLGDSLDEDFKIWMGIE